MLHKVPLSGYTGEVREVLHIVALSTFLAKWGGGKSKVSLFRLAQTFSFFFFMNNREQNQVERRFYLKV